jgi:hypothetical protein
MWLVTDVSEGHELNFHHRESLKSRNTVQWIILAHIQAVLWFNIDHRSGDQDLRFSWICCLPGWMFSLLQLLWWNFSIQDAVQAKPTVLYRFPVGIATGYGLDDRGSGVRFPARTGNFSLHHRDQTGSGAHPSSCPVVNSGSFPGSKAAGAWSWPLISS